MTSAPAALSPVATTVQHGRFFHAGGPDASLNAVTAVGRWVAAISATVSAGRSAANASRNSAGLTASSTAVSPFQLDASAKAPCTSTIVGLTPVCLSVASTGNLLHVGTRAHAELPSTIAPDAMPSRP